MRIEKLAVIFYLLRFKIVPQMGTFIFLLTSNNVNIFGLFLYLNTTYDRALSKLETG